MFNASLKARFENMFIEKKRTIRDTTYPFTTDQMTVLSKNYINNRAKDQQKGKCFTTMITR